MESVSVGGKNYVKASVVARDLGYTADYVGQLCRSGKVDAQLVGRTWYVHKPSIQSHRSTRYRSVRAKSVESLKEQLEKPDTLHFYTFTKVTTPAYSTDDAELMPAINKKGAQRGSIEVGLADAAPVKVRKGDDAYTFATTDLPEIRFRGKIPVSDAEDPASGDGPQIHIHPKSTEKKPKNIEISSNRAVPTKDESHSDSVRTLRQGMLERKSAEATASAGRSTARSEVVYVAESGEGRQGTVVVMASSFVASAAVACLLLGLELQIRATNSTLLTSYRFDVENVTATAIEALQDPVADLRSTVLHTIHF